MLSLKFQHKNHFVGFVKTLQDNYGLLPCVRVLLVKSIVKVFINFIKAGCLYFSCNIIRVVD
jgi:hypothetical protein